MSRAALNSSWPLPGSMPTASPFGFSLLAGETGGVAAAAVVSAGARLRVTLGGAALLERCVTFGSRDVSRGVPGPESCEAPTEGPDSTELPGRLELSVGLGSAPAGLSTLFELPVSEPLPLAAG